jgi:hypothetical protein
VQTLEQPPEQLPPILFINGEEYFIYSILDHVRQSLQFFREIEEKFSKLNSLNEKLDAIDKCKGRFITEIPVLRDEKNTLEKLCNEKRVQQDQTIFDYFIYCVSLLDKVWKYLNNLCNT